MRLLAKGDSSDAVKKSIGSLTRQEKRKLKSGDKSVLFSKLGIASEADINRLKREFGISGEIELDHNNIDQVLEGATKLGRKRSRFRLRNEAEDKERMKAMILEHNENKGKLEYMDEEDYIK